MKNSKEKKYLKRLENYRKDYLLDPNGSNSKYFFKKATKMLEELLSNYTGQQISAKIKIKKGNKIEAKIIDIAQVKKNKAACYKTATKSLPKKGQTIDKTIQDLADVAKGEIRFTHKFIGQMHPHDNIASFVAGIAAKFINGNTIAQEVSPTTTHIEAQTINWIAKAIGYKTKKPSMSKPDFNNKTKKYVENMLKEESSSGNITLGGTTANFSAYVVARNKALKDVAEKGIKDISGVVIGSEYSHYSHEKLCGYLGIGNDNFIKAKTKNLKLDAKDKRAGALKSLLWEYGHKNKKVIGVFATAGTTETGSIDDLEGISKLLKKFKKKFGYKPYFHVDAAHGGGFVYHKDFNPKKNGKLKGLQYADSVTIDPHKMFYTNYSAGAIIFKNKKDHSMLKQSAPYLFKDNGDANLGEFRIEGSMSLEGALQTWATFKTFGKEGFQTIQEHAIRMTKYLRKKAEKQGFEILNEPEMNLLCFRYNNKDLSDELNDTINRKAQEKMYKRGNAYISNDKLLYRKNENDEGKKIDVFRAVIMHPYTTKKEINNALKEINICIEDTIKKVLKT